MANQDCSGSARVSLQHNVSLFYSLCSDPYLARAGESSEKHNIFLGKRRRKASRDPRGLCCGFFQKIMYTDIFLSQEKNSPRSDSVITVITKLLPMLGRKILGPVEAHPSSINKHWTKEKVRETYSMDRKFYTTCT